MFKNAFNSPYRNRKQTRQVLSSFQAQDQTSQILEHTTRINQLTMRLRSQNNQVIQSLRHQKLSPMTLAIQDQRAPDYSSKFLFVRKRFQ